MGRAQSRIVKVLSAGVILAVLLIATHTLWMTALGEWLVRADAPAKADIALVLGGDHYGHRILRAAELVKAGYVPKVLVSGSPGFYGLHESDLAIPFAVKHGYPESWFIPVPNEALSTVSEAAAVMRELRRRGVRSLLLVTNDYHTRRAGKAYRRIAPDLALRVVAAPDEFFTPGNWWHSREGRKTLFLEWSKTVATWIGL